MAKRMRRSLVALSASIVAAIYTAGYIHTQSADASLAAAEHAPIVAASPSPTAQPSTVLAPRLPNDSRFQDDDDDDFAERGRRGLPAPTASPTPSAGRAATTTPPAYPAVYRDGAYQGAGRSRRGDVEVTVTVQEGSITRVSLDTVTTYYPVRYIAGLPAQVIARQSANVDMISGATISVVAFRTAVQQALAQAL